MTQRFMRAAARLLVPTVCAVALTGCGSFSFMNFSSLPNWFGGSDKAKPAELTANPATFAVRQAWAAHVAAVEFPLTVNVQGNAITVASSDGTITSLDAASGRELWRASAGAPIAAGVGSDGKVTAVVTTQNELVAFEGAKEIWRQRLTVGSYTAPLVAGARVFLLHADRSVAAFDGATGRRLWTQTRPQTEPLILKNPGVIIPVGDTLVVGIGGRMVGLNPLTGQPRWEAPVATARGINDVERLVDLVGTVSRVNNVVCTRSFQTNVGCVDTSRAAVLWTKTANGSEGVGGDVDFVFGTERNGTVRAWKRENGDTAWSTDLLANRGLSAPLAVGKAVAMGDGFGYVHLLSREDGKLMNRLTTDESAITAAPVLAANTLVVVTKKGGIFGFVPQ